MLKRAARFLAVALMASVALSGTGGGQAAYAWGPEGHVLIARLAEGHLTPRTRQAMLPLLEGRSLADVASWADDWRTFHPNTGRWHFVDVPFDQAVYDGARDCPKGDCVVQALKGEIAKLSSLRTPLLERRRALRFVVHFLGDLHQPLHAVDRDDRGGNEVRAQIVLQDGEFPYHSMRNANLHSVWDNELLESAHRDQASYMAVLERLPAASSSWSKGTIVDWVNEAHRLALDPAYARLPSATDAAGPGQVLQLGATYVEACRPVAETQIQKAGLRLARILNEALTGS